MIMGVVADDITGSNDIGSMFAKSGLLTHIYTYAGPGDYARLAAGHATPEICILDTNSRLAAPEIAYQKVFAATQELRAAGCGQFFNKTCSVFRGNIGAEFDAMLDALGRDFAVVVLGFPKNGRTTIDGIHYVHGRRLEDSEFQHDPIHPMTHSNLVDILQAQTSRRVARLSHAIVRQGSGALRQHIQQMHGRCHYLILDVTEQADLTTIAGAVYDEPVLCGSSALAEELPAAWGNAAPAEETLALPAREGVGILCAAGSLMPQTRDQIAYLHRAGALRVALDTLRLFDAGERAQEIEQIARAIAGALQTGQDVVFHAPNDPAAVAATRQAGDRAGLSNTEIADRVSGAIAEVTARVLAQTAQNRLVVAGGETSAAVCEQLGVRGMRVWQEICPGLPSCISLGDPAYLLVLKSGSFGGPDFFQQAIAHLRAR
ncbi:MAG: four-carbon acid sugar kinase family protein [Anaerolineae bacterium]|nr:four-carbon acid sugar kinase family protein [Anaerolineae bacterium]